MKITAFSDSHTEHKLLSNMGLLPPADVLICGGDISYRGTEPEVKNFLDWFLRLEGFAHKIFIAGNHDFWFERYPDKMKNTVLPDNVHYLNDSGVTIDGVKFWGSPITPWFHNWAFNRDRGEEIKEHWDLIPLDTNVLITHGPPYNILDEVLYESRYNPEKKVGCRDLLNKIGELKDLKANIFGHIHEGYGEMEVNGVRFFNASFMTRDYEPINKPFTFEI